jgi:hypothetical protein
VIITGTNKKTETAQLAVPVFYTPHPTGGGWEGALFLVREFAVDDFIY